MPQKEIGTLVIFSKYNITGDDFANLFVAQFSQAGRQLKQASQFKKFMNTLNGFLFLSIFKILIKKVVKKNYMGQHQLIFLNRMVPLSYLTMNLQSFEHFYFFHILL